RGPIAGSLQCGIPGSREGGIAPPQLVGRLARQAHARAGAAHIGRGRQRLEELPPARRRPAVTTEWFSGGTPMDGGHDSLLPMRTKRESAHIYIHRHVGKCFLGAGGRRAGRPGQPQPSITIRTKSTVWRVAVANSVAVAWKLP